MKLQSCQLNKVKRAVHREHEGAEATLDNSLKRLLPHTVFRVNGPAMSALQELVIVWRPWNRLNFHMFWD